MEWVRGRPGEAAILLFTATVVSAAVLFGAAAPDMAGALATGATYGLALVACLAVGVRILARDPSAAPPQLFVAVAGFLWAATAMAPGLPKAVSLLAVAALVLAAFRVPPDTGLMRVTARVGLDAAVLGVAATAAVIPRLDPGTSAVDPVLWLELPLVLVALFGTSLAILRKPSRHLYLLIGGGALMSAGAVWQVFDQVTALRAGGAWGADTVLLAGCGLACTGLVRLSHPTVRLPVQDPARALRGERRDLVIHAVVTAVALAMLVVTGIGFAFLGRETSLRDMTPPVAAGIILAVREVAVMIVRRRLVRAAMSASRIDVLTGLLNRVGLSDHLDGRDAQDGALVVIDIDGFARINELLGQSSADRLLVGVGAGLRSVALPKGAVLARTGGDEFAVWVPWPGIPLELAHQLVVAATSWTAGTDTVVLTVSAGVAGTGRIGGWHDGADELPVADLLLQRASAALVEAKRNGPASVAIFDAQLADAHRRRLLVERRLTTILRGEPVAPGTWLGLHYQPLVDLASGRVVGVEALARWEDPVLGSVSPVEFIHVAEQTGLIVSFGRRMLEIVGEVMGGQRSPDGSPLSRPDLSVGVNVSAAQLHARPDGIGFADLVVDVLDRCGVDPARLVVEVTESMLISQDDPAVAELRRLIDAGISVAIDDFGSGYWALGYLQWLPAQILKVDQRLVAQLGRDSRSETVVTGIVKLAQDLGMAVVVEGVETAGIAARAAELGAVLAQGWHFAAAVPLAAVPATIDRVEASWPPTVTTSLPTQRAQPVTDHRMSERA